MLALVGKDRPGIVAEVTHVLYEMKGNLGETSMVRLGGNFTIMLMVCIPEKKELIYEKLRIQFKKINRYWYCFIKRKEY